jgi:hypothetical protein
MAMQMAMVLVPRQRMLQVQRLGGATTTVFPRAERSLRSLENQRALKHVKTSSQPETYHSVMDWLFCNVYPHERPACFSFYAGTGKQLRFLKTPSELRLYDAGLLGVIRKARKALKDGRTQRWSELTIEARGEVRKCST